MILVEALAEPIKGYWNGGRKRRFEWRIDGTPQTDKRGQFVRVGSYEANYWFNVAVGKTDKRTLANARLHLAAAARKNRLSATFTYEEA